MNARVAALLLLLVPGCSIGLSVADGGPTGEPQSLTADASRGKPIYLRDCAPCHGDTGEGNGPLAGKFDPPPTDLVAWGVRVSVKDLDVVFQTPHYSSYVMSERVAGGNREMPAWNEVLTRQEIDDVVAYVRSLIQAHPHAEVQGPADELGHRRDEQGAADASGRGRDAVAGPVGPEADAEHDLQVVEPDRRSLRDGAPPATSGATPSAITAIRSQTVAEVIAEHAWPRTTTRSASGTFWSSRCRGSASASATASSRRWANSEVCG